MTHLGYILIAYGLSAVVIAGLALWIRLDIAAQKRKLAVLENRGPAGRADRARS